MLRCLESMGRGYAEYSAEVEAGRVGPGDDDMTEWVRDWVTVQLRAE